MKLGEADIDTAAANLLTFARKVDTTKVGDPATLAVGTWRRGEHIVTVSPWRSLSADAHYVIETEAASFPLPDLSRPIDVR